MRKIQEYNNFRRSTYTPTQSTEDLTKEDSKTVTVTKSVPAEVDLIEHDEAVTGDGNNNINNNGPAIKPGGLICLMFISDVLWVQIPP